MKPPIFESAFPGSNLHLIQARTSKDLYEAIETESKRRGTPIPELVRDFLSFHLIPGALKGKISEGKELDSKDRALLEACRNYLSDIAEACAGIDESQRKIEFKKVKRHLTGDWFEKLIEKKVDEVITRQKKGRAK